MTDFVIHHGNALDVLKTLESESVQTCITSPPYFGLRDYGVAGQIGLESTPQAFVAALVAVFEEVRRVLRKDGTLWLNLGDSYAGSGQGRNGDGESSAFKGQGGTATQMQSNRDGLKFVDGYKPKDLMGMPWRVAFALQEAGWWLRQDIIWAKPNPMPESVTDRCTKSHEYIFLLTKSAKYFYDAEAIKERLKDSSVGRLAGCADGNFAISALSNAELSPYGKQHNRDRSLPRNRNGITGTLDAVRPPHGIVRDRLLNYDSKESVLRPNVERGGFESEHDLPEPEMYANKKSVWTVTTKGYKEAHFATFPEKLIEPCILAGSREGDLVLDPFSGAATTGLVSLKHKRRYVGIELNAEYIKLSERRLREIQVKLF